MNEFNKSQMVMRNHPHLLLLSPLGTLFPRIPTTRLLGQMLPRKGSHSGFGKQREEAQSLLQPQNSGNLQVPMSYCKSLWGCPELPLFPALSGYMSTSSSLLTLLWMYKLLNTFYLKYVAKPWLIQVKDAQSWKESQAETRQLWWMGSEISVGSLLFHSHMQAPFQKILTEHLQYLKHSGRT